MGGAQRRVRNVVEKGRAKEDEEDVEGGNRKRCEDEGDDGALYKIVLC